MKKRFVLMLLVALLLGSGYVTYAWWSSSDQEVDNTLTMGYGLRLEVASSTENQDEVLVPEGSTFDGAEGYTHAYVFTYTIELDPVLTGTYDLDVEISNILIDSVAYNGYIENHGLLMFDVSVDNAEIGEEVDEFADTNVTAPTDLYDDETVDFDKTEFALIEDVISDAATTVVVTITVYLAPDSFVPTALGCGGVECDMSASYAALAGKPITFTAAFELFVAVEE